MEDNNPIVKLINNNFKYRAFSVYRAGDNPSLIDTLLLVFTSLFIEPIKVLIMYIPGGLGIIMRNFIYKLFGCKIGYRAIIDQGVIVNGYKNLKIGEYTWIDKHVELSIDTGFVSIGKRVHIAPFSNIVGLGGVSIGDYSAVGRFAQLLSHSEVSKSGLRMSGPMVSENEKGSKSAPIIIGTDVVIGTGSVIMPGVNIGDGAIIAPNSLILGNIRPWTINVGVPSKIVGIREKVNAD